MKTFPVPDLIRHKYHGSGYALAAVSNGALVSFAYIQDVLPDFDSAHEHAALIAIKDNRLGPTLRELSALGEVSFGMLSSHEFTEL